MSRIVLDLRPKANKKELATLHGRLKRQQRLGASATNARDELLKRGDVNRLAGNGLRIRDDFVYWPDAPELDSEDKSDRRLPAPESRSSATRIMDSRSPALRFYLTAIANAQLRVSRGHASNDLPIRGARHTDVGWIDLMASASGLTSSGKTVSNPKDKKERSLHRALDRLESAGLVALPNKGKGANKRDGFIVMHEIGARYTGDPVEYQIPTKREPVFSLPGGFITNGWIHVLEDTEIAMLMMVACGLSSLPNKEKVAIEGTDRLRHYGIGRNAFGAHKMLGWLGLLSVEEVARHEDGRAIDHAEDGPSLHRLAIRPDGFEADAVTRLQQELEHQLGRT